MIFEVLCFWIGLTCLGCCGSCFFCFGYFGNFGLVCIVLLFGLGFDFICLDEWFILVILVLRFVCLGFGGIAVVLNICKIDFLWF